MAAPRLIADLPVTLLGPVVRRAYPAIRAVTALARSGDCLDLCQGDLQYCTDENPATDILCEQGRICAEKCTCLANALACDDHCLSAAIACDEACGEHASLECVLACDPPYDFCSTACSDYQHDCNAWAEATHGGGIGGEPEDEITPTCRVSEVTVWINAFIPGNLPGLTLDRPGHPGQTMLPDVPGPADCFLTDQRGLSNDIGKSARLHLAVTVDANTNSFRDPQEGVGQTIEVDCDTGAVVDVGVAEISPESILNTLRASDFANLAPGLFTCRLEAEVSNPLVLFSFFAPIVWSGNLAIGIFPFRTADGRMIELARIEFSGRVGEFPAFEMYASVNGTPGVPVFQRMPDPDATPADLFAGAANPIDEAAIIDCFGNPQGRSARPAARRVEPPASMCPSCSAAPGSRTHYAGSSMPSMPR